MKLPIDRFMEKVQKDFDGCWTWTGVRHRQGYGYFRFHNQMVRAHRWLYEATVGPIPTGLHLDHLCRNRSCVNPAHLEAVTRAENAARGSKATQTHCKNGHEFTDENTYRYGGPRGDNRRCRTCNTEAKRRDRKAA